MNRVCPLSCKIVKGAIKAYEERGVVMGEYIDYHKESNSYCLMCARNEKSTLPVHMRRDNGVASKEPSKNLSLKTDGEAVSKGGE